jgi:hypothetical protein
MGRREIQNSTSASSRVGGIRGCWKVCRRFACTTGWYPLWVAPIVTVGCLLSLYSSSGCQFIDLNVGFTPSNLAWNSSQAELGLFYYHSKHANGSSGSSIAEGSDNRWYPLGDFLQNECIWYTEAFQESVIDRDRTWRVARVMAMIAVGSSLLAALTVWLIVFVPVPIACVWPGILLPNTMLSFIAEGSKFLFFDIALCRNSVWFPSGVDSWPEEAESCNLHKSSYIGIAAAALHLVALLSICLHVPKKRDLDPDFGLRSVYQSANEPESHEVSMGPPNRRIDATRHPYDDEDPSILDEDMYTEGPSPANSSLILKQQTVDYFDEPDSTSKDDSSEPTYDYEVPTASDSLSPSSNISASRIEAFSRMQAASVERDESQERMIAELLTDLNKTLGDLPYK